MITRNLSKLEIRSKTIYLRLVKEADASFILSLRTNDNFNKYLSFVEDNIDNQVKWIRDYKLKEKNGCEFYFIIHRIDNNEPIGTVRVYDFIQDQNSFCWGSWILNENKTRYAALETAIAIYDLAFTEMGFDQCHMDIRKGNIKVIDFHKRFGVKIVDESEIDFFGIYLKQDYLNIRDSILEIIKRESL